MLSAPGTEIGGSLGRRLSRSVGDIAVETGPYRAISTWLQRAKILAKSLRLARW